MKKQFFTGTMGTLRIIINYLSGQIVWDHIKRHPPMQGSVA